MGTGRRPRSFPLWLRAADSAQRSERRPLPIAVDGGLAAAATAAVSRSAPATAAAVAVMVASGLVFGVWKRRSCVQAQGVAWYVRRLFPGGVLSGATLALFPTVGLEKAALGATAVIASLSTVKAVLWAVVGTARRRGLGLRPALIVGPEKSVAGVEYRIHLYPEAGLVCAHSQVLPSTGGGARIAQLMGHLVARHAVEHVVFTGDSGEAVIRNMIRLAPPSLEVTVVTSVPLVGSATNRLGDLAVVGLSRPSWGSDACKRAFDVAAALVLLALLGPVMVAVAAAIRLGDGGPAIFRQLRTGRGNQQFTILKFRSMVVNAEELKPAVMDRNVADGRLFKAIDDPRVTPVGTVIRRFSLDELPQLINVLRGDMSLVGPRPLPSVFDDTDLLARRRHQILPGITGLWQVKGANALSYEDMLDLDCAYVAGRSLGLDLRILLQTIPAVMVQRAPF